MRHRVGQRNNPGPLVEPIETPPIALSTSGSTPTSPRPSLSRMSLPALDANVSRVVRQSLVFAGPRPQRPRPLRSPLSWEGRINRGNRRRGGGRGGQQEMRQVRAMRPMKLKPRYLYGSGTSGELQDTPERHPMFLAAGRRSRAQRVLAVRGGPSSFRARRPPTCQTQSKPLNGGREWTADRLVHSSSSKRLTNFKASKPVSARMTNCS